MGEHRASDEEDGVHPDERDIVAFASGDLDATERLTMDEHIDACPSCRGAVAALLVDLGTQETLASPTLGPPAPREPGELLLGTAVDRYVVERVIGRGGMGIIYEARDPELGRRVALKVLRDPVASASAERLQREAQALALVAHPNVVTVYDAGTANGRVFLAMTLVLGDTLRGWLESTARTREEVLAAMLASGRGLLAAHERGLVHRDFKPENVLVGLASPAGPDEPTFVVTDFGLVAAADREAPRSGAAHLAADLTRPGAILGTPAYMALEQLRGHRADPRADQFAFAVTLFEALAGRRPFVGKNIPELAGAVMKGTIDWASPRFDLGELGPVLGRALSAKKEDRFDSLTPVLAAIESELAPKRRRLKVRAHRRRARRLLR